MAEIPVEDAGPHQDVMQLNVSTTFFPAALLPGIENIKSDLIFFSSDCVAFYCHKSVIKSKSTNDFGHLLSTTPRLFSMLLSSGSRESALESYTMAGNMPTTITVVETSIVFNIVLHMIYSKIPSTRYGPTIETVEEALGVLPKYGIPVPEDESDIWSILIAHAPEHPLRVYGIGAANASESVCIQASPFTLGISLGFLTEADALTMGPDYLRRLTFLHVERVEALKEIISKPLEEHGDCTVRLEVSLAWREAAAQVLLAQQPQNLPASTLVATFGPVATAARCYQCTGIMQTRISTMCREWNSVPRTI